MSMDKLIRGLIQKTDEQTKILKDVYSVLARPRTIPKVEKSIIALGSAVRILSDNVDALTKYMKTKFGEDHGPMIPSLGGDRVPEKK